MQYLPYLIFNIIPYRDFVDCPTGEHLCRYILRFEFIEFNTNTQYSKRVGSINTFSNQSGVRTSERSSEQKIKRQERDDHFLVRLIFHVRVPPFFNYLCQFHKYRPDSLSFHQDAIKLHQPLLCLHTFHYQYSALWVIIDTIFVEMYNNLQGGAT